MITIPRLIDRAATWYGDAPAVVDGERCVSFREIGERSSRLANALISLTPDAGSRVAVLTPNRLEFVEIDFAVAKAGKVKVPINPRLADEEREFVLANSGTDTLIFDAQFAAFVEEARQRLPDLRQLIVLGKARDAYAYEDLLAQGSTGTPAIDHAPDAPNLILYTSGTAGRPKGAIATNRSRLAATLNMLAEEIDPVPGDAMIHAGSMTHGSGSKILAYFLRGARNLPMSAFEPDRFLHLVERERATATFLVPTMIAMLVEAATRTRIDFSSLKTVTYGGAPIAPARLAEALDRFGNVFVQVYGSCEAPHPVFVLRKHDHLVPPGKERRLGSVGREVAMVEIRIVDPEGRPLEDGEPGEMLIRGPNVMAGYWKNLAATNEVLRNGWYRSGDVITRDEDGFCYIVDRARDLIISGGLNVYPAEVEAALHKHPAVADAVVIGVPDDHWGESVKAFIVLRPGVTATESEIVDHTRLHLAGYKKPRSVEFVPSLPKGPTGKVLKRKLREVYWRGSDRGVH